MALKVKMTYHAREDRIDRLSECVAKLGVGEVILENIYNSICFKLTSTGLCLLYAPNSNKLITGYMCTLERALSMYSSEGKKIPKEIKNTILYNVKKYYYLLEK